MRPFHSLLILTLCLTAMQAQDQKDQAQPVSGSNTKDTKPREQDRGSSDSQQDEPQKATLMKEPSPEDLYTAKEGIKAMLSQFPIQHVEPLVSTMDGYCSSFHNLCQAACKERITEEEEVTVDKEQEKKISGCLDPKARSVNSAAASCQCAGYDFTDRINFAIVGGIVTSKTSNTSEFGSEAILDHLTFLPTIPTFISIINILQTVCYYISYLDILATNPSPVICLKDDKGAGLMGAITSLIPGLGSLIPSLGSVGGFLKNIPVVGGLLGGLFGGGEKGGETSAPPGLGGLLGGIFGGAKPTPTPTTGAGSGGGGGIGDLFGGIFGGGNPTSKSVVMPTPTSATTTTTAAAGGGIGGAIGDFFGGIFGGSKPTSKSEAVTSSTTAGGGGLFGGIFGGGPPKTTMPTTTTMMMTAVATTAQSGAKATATSNKTTATASPTPTPTPTPGPLFGFIPRFGWFSETDGNGDIIDTDDETKSQDPSSRLVSPDGRVARIVRVQRKQAEKRSAAAAAKKAKADL